MNAAARLSPILIRKATEQDVPRLVEMNHAAYPELVEEGVVWSASQLHAHLARFPEGQVVAEVGGDVKGAISTFIVPASRDPMAQHTWLDITDHGTFASHDARGDTLYLADVYVDPSARGTGVGYELIRRSLESLVRHGCKKVTLTVTSANTEAIALYERMGFRKTRNFSAYVWEGFGPGA